MNELRYTIRSLARNPSFSVVTILTLAIGIGAATAIYSVVDTILFRPLPFAGGDRLVQLIEYGPHFQAGQPAVRRNINYQEYQSWRDRAKTIEEAAAIVGMSQRMVKTPDGAAGLWGAMVSGNVFALLPTRPHLGRLLQPADDANPDVIVLSYDTWRRHYHSDPAIIGRALEVRMGALLAARPPMFLTVVGVLPADFEFPTQRLDFVMPIRLDSSQRPPGASTIARLANGVSLEAATQEANAMGTAIRSPWPADKMPPVGPRFEYKSVKEQLVEPFRPAARVILSAVVVLLLIVCANVANLLLARGTTRRREIAVRLAVGASRGQVFRQVLLECVVLAAAGGALGALLGAGGVVLVRNFATVDAPGVFRFTFASTILPRANEVSVDWRLFGIAIAIAAITAAVFGVLPALQLSRADHLRAMGSRGVGASRGESRLRSGLTLAQLTMATVLLTGAALLANSFVKLATFNKGYDPSNVLVFNLLFPDTYSTAHKGETIAALLARFRANPGVTAAGFARHGLLIGEELYIGRFIPPGKTLAEMEKERGVRTRSVSDGFLTAMGVPILQGRDLSPTDSGDAPGAIVINRSAARRYFGDSNPVGQSMEWAIGKTQLHMTVVGVVEDMHQEEATDALVPEIFFDYRQYLAIPGANPAGQNESAIGFLSFALRTPGDPATLIPAVRESITSIDPNIGIDTIVPMEQLEASSRAKQRFYAVMLGVFAVVSGVLAAIGVYGVLSYAVTQRSKEIGVRIALGARAGQVLALIMRRGLALTVVGVTLGLVAAAVGARSLESMLFGIKPLDPPTFIAVAIGFAIVAAIASYVPALNATRVDPVVTLRDE